MNFQDLQARFRVSESTLSPVAGYSIRVNPKSNHLALMIELFKGKKKVGYAKCIAGKRLENFSKKEEIKTSLDSLGLANPDIWVLDNAWITDEESRGKGLGVELYVAAVNEVGKRGGALTANFMYMGSGTSTDARRVWDSEKFKARVSSNGYVAVSKEFQKNGDSLVSSSKNLLELTRIWATTKGMAWSDMDGKNVTKEEDKINNFREISKRHKEITDEEIEAFIQSKTKKKK